MHFLESIMCLSNLDSIVGPLSMACIPDASAGTELFPVDVIHMCIPFEWASHSKHVCVLLHVICPAFWLYVTYATQIQGIRAVRISKPQRK